MIKKRLERRFWIYVQPTKILLVPTKFRHNFWFTVKCRNIGFFSIAPMKVIALNICIIYVSFLYGDSGLLFYIASHIVIALPTIALECNKEKQC